MAINNQGHLEVTTKETGYNDSQYSIFNCWNKSIRMQLHTFSFYFETFFSLYNDPKQYMAINHQDHLEVTTKETGYNGS